MNRLARRNSEWRVISRCFALLSLLMREDASRARLVEIIQHDADSSNEQVNDDALIRRFDNDMKRLRTQLGAIIVYDKGAKSYRFESLDNALIDLPEDAMRGLSFLQSTFGDPGTPYGDHVRALIDRIKALLPERRRSELDRMTGQLELDLHPRDDDMISDQTWDAIWRACHGQRQIEFDYMSKNDARVWRRFVEPERYYFEDGHYYMDGRCLRKESTNGWLTVNDYRQYRIGRISNIQVLPTRNHYPPVRPRADLCVLVRPFLVKQGVPRLTNDDKVTLHENGEAIIQAHPVNLFMTLHRLLSYGPHIKVIGDAAAIAQMRTLVHELLSEYPDNEPE